jgi:hypothetical protein
MPSSDEKLIMALGIPLLLDAPGDMNREIFFESVVLGSPYLRQR